MEIPVYPTGHDTGLLVMDSLLSYFSEKGSWKTVTHGCVQRFHVVPKRPRIRSCDRTRVGLDDYPPTGSDVTVTELRKNILWHNGLFLRQCCSFPHFPDIAITKSYKVATNRNAIHEGPTMKFDAVDLPTGNLVKPVAIMRPLLV